MLVKGLQWWAMGLNPHNCTRSTGATIIPLLQKIYPNHGIISSDSFHLEVYNFEKKCVHHDFTPMTIRLSPRLPEDLKSWIAEASSDSSCFNCTWQGNQTHWVIGWHASDMAELWAERTAELPMVMRIYWYVLMCHKYGHMVRLLNTSIQSEMCVGKGLG